MPSSAQIQEAKQIEQELQLKGHAVRINVRGVPKAQWYREDGSALPNHLPADAHHRERYQKRGWSLIPPAEVVKYVPSRIVGGVKDKVQDLDGTMVEPEVIDDEAAREQKIVDLQAQVLTLQKEGQTFDDLPDKDKLKEELKPHAHRFPSRTLGSKCDIAWCEAVRVTEYQERVSKKNKGKRKGTRV